MMQVVAGALPKEPPAPQEGTAFGRVLDSVPLNRSGTVDMRLPVPANRIEAGFARPEDLIQSFTSVFDSNAGELRLTTRQPDFRLDQAGEDRKPACTRGPSRRSMGGLSRNGDC